MTPNLKVELIKVFYDAANHTYEVTRKENLKVASRHERVSHFVTDLRRTLLYAGVIKHEKYLFQDLSRLLCDKGSWHDILKPIKIDPLRRPLSTCQLPTSEEIESICKDVLKQFNNDPAYMFSGDIASLKNLVYESGFHLKEMELINQEAENVLKKITNLYR
jgi:hypothetical protein